MRELAKIFAALSDESRLRLLYAMRKGETCVCYLQEVLQTNQPKTSRHLAYLRKAGLVEVRREGKWVYYSLKQLDTSAERILKELFKQLDSEAQIRVDTKRLEKICCSPSRFGLPSPSENAA